MGYIKRQEIMLAHVDQLEESGLTVKAYAEKMDIPYNRMEYWCRRKRELETKKQTESPTFVQVNDMDDNRSFQGFNQPGNPQAVLRFSNGLRLEIYS